MGESATYAVDLGTVDAVADEPAFAFGPQQSEGFIACECDRLGIPAGDAKVEIQDDRRERRESTGGHVVSGHRAADSLETSARCTGSDETYDFAPVTGGKRLGHGD